MIVVHHLNNSRSQRILWLLEELGQPYEIKPYQRVKETNLAPPELKAVHPLGRSPMIEDDGQLIIESGAIVEHLVGKAGGGLAPAPGTPAHAEYLQWLHFGEGSAMGPMIASMLLKRLGEPAADLLARQQQLITDNLLYMERALEGREWLVEDRLSGADIVMGFVAEAANIQKRLGDYPNLQSYVARIQARPAYQRALQKGGPTIYARPKAPA